MIRILLFSGITLCCIAFIACESTIKKQEKYYYSNTSSVTAEPQLDTVLNLVNDQMITDFIKAKTFTSKGNKMIFDDSLNVTFFINGKKESTYHCELQEYMLKGEKLLMMMDSTHTRHKKFTIAQTGIITDMETYSLYKIRE